MVRMTHRKNNNLNCLSYYRRNIEEKKIQTSFIELTTIYKVQIQEDHSEYYNIF